MKTLKILLVLLVITVLTGCNKNSIPETINFDRMEFSYVGLTDDDYLLYESGNFRLELHQKDDGTVTASYEKFQDIYLIEGTKSDYQIRKNGILVQICTKEEAVSCTGFEQVDFSKDAVNLFEVYTTDSVSTTIIILGVLVGTGIVSLFFIPKKYLEKVKIKNVHLSQTALIRTFIILLILIGSVIIILSL